MTARVPPEVPTDWDAISAFVPVVMSPVLTGGCGLVLAVELCVDVFPVEVEDEAPGIFMLMQENAKLTSTRISNGKRIYLAAFFIYSPSTMSKMEIPGTR